MTGEVALGSLQTCARTIALLQQLPQAPTASDQEVLYVIERQHWYGRGIGWVDAHLLASTRLTGDVQLWTRDKRLAAVARDLDLGRAKN